MSFNEHSALLLLLILIRGGTYDCSVIKRDSNEGIINGSQTKDSALGKSLFDGIEERNLEQEILRELNHLSSRKQRQIFNDLEKQHEKFNTPLKTLALSEPENLSPLNAEELKNIRNTIKTSNGSLPAIRNKRTLNFLLYAVARAMGYTLTPTNPDAEWIPRSRPTPAQPCTTPAPPCTPNPPSVPPPCAVPPSAPPCSGSGALMQPATIPPNQIDANTINYPYRPVRTIPLFNFAPLPVGVRVPYPPLLQPPVRQRSSCLPQQPSPPCGTTPAPSPPPCMPSPTPGTPPPRRPATPPCDAAPSPPPCGTTPVPRPPSPPPCTTTPAPPPPCAGTPPPPAATPVPPSSCGTPAPVPCGNPSPPPPPSQPPTKGSILLEYDDPVRIQIFSNGKKYLPASGSIYSGHDDDQKEDFHSSFVPAKKKDEDYEEKEEMEEERFEEEEEDETPGQLQHYEKEDERTSANGEEDESETSLSIVKKPSIVEDLGKVNRRQLVSSSTKTSVADENGEKDEKGDNSKYSKAEKSSKVKKPKRKKWVRIVKKQRRKTKTDSSPHNYFPAYSSDSFPEASQTASKLYGRRDSHTGFESFEKDVSDYSPTGDSSIDTSEDVTQLDLKKVIVDNKALHLPDRVVGNRRYEFNINPYALEPEEERRQKIEKAVERYVEDYVEKQLGDELVKNTGVPKTTVFEFAPKNGPKIQTITTTVAKTSHSGNSANSKLRNKPDASSIYKVPIRNAHALRTDSYQENLDRRGDASYEAFRTRT